MYHVDVSMHLCMYVCLRVYVLARTCKCVCMWMCIYGGCVWTYVCMLVQGWLCNVYVEWLIGLTLVDLCNQYNLARGHKGKNKCLEGQKLTVKIRGIHRNIYRYINSNSSIYMDKCMRLPQYVCYRLAMTVTEMWSIFNSRGVVCPWNWYLHAKNKRFLGSPTTAWTDER